MDELVKQALAKWPNVPHCYGWLALDARGDWYMRDDRIQAAGPFPQVKGSRIEHDKLKDFIARNYQGDDSGCWHFQNGPHIVLRAFGVGDDAEVVAQLRPFLAFLLGQASVGCRGIESKARRSFVNLIAFAALVGKDGGHGVRVQRL